MSHDPHAVAHYVEPIGHQLHLREQHIKDKGRGLNVCYFQMLALCSPLWIRSLPQLALQGDCDLQLRPAPCLYFIASWFSDM